MMLAKQCLVILLLSLLLHNGWGGWFWGRRRRRRQPPACSATDCQVSEWKSWSSCSVSCGNEGNQYRLRTITSVKSCGGSCPYSLREEQRCNRYTCHNGGTPDQADRCSCRSGFTGTCCEYDVNECVNSPCQHACTNNYGSYTCKCDPCWTKLGTRCDLRQCKIRGSCYAYGKKNPSNACQDCNSANQWAWTSNNALPCSDGNLCTRADHCVNGRCVGTPFTCLPCERCNGNTCTVKPGFCTIIVNGRKTCLSHNALRPGFPCQECNSNSPHQWTNNNNLPCSDNNHKTKDDRCVNGGCRGTPYSCLPCESHDGQGCPLKNGHCVIQHNGARNCFANQQLKPGNPCQWCNPSSSTSTWTNKNGVSCDDSNKCTRSDTCTNGQCTGTAFICNSHCQTCNGRNCSQKPGFGIVNGTCTCKIAGRDYNHQQLNPSNQCQWCDLYHAASKSTGTWTNRPSVSCDDRNNCTKRDMCTQGRCVGQPYSCQSSYPSTSCIRTSVCLGDGRCKDLYRSAGTICKAARDVCDQPERCNGGLGSCPAVVTDPITITTGNVDFQNSAYTSSASYQHITNVVFFKVSNFNISCGQMTFKWYLLNGSSSCNNATSTKGQLSNTNTKQSISGLTLQDSKTYKLAIQAMDMRGGTRPLVCTSDLTIDTSVPQNGWVRDGSAADINYQYTKTITANWGGFTIRNGVQKYEWKVSYTAFGRSNPVNLLSLTSTGVITSASKVFSNIADGSRVKVLVRAYTKAGLYSERTSDGVVVDLSKPIAAKVYDGSQTGVDARYVKWTTTFSVNWDAFTDPHSGMLYYEWAVKRHGVGLMTAYKKTAMNRSSSASGINLVSGERYCAVVKGYNKAKLFTESSSNCVLIDRDPPRAGNVNDGAANDIQHQSNGTTISANWKGFSDGIKGSGIVGYQYKITNSRNKDVIGWNSVGMKASISHSGLPLINGVKYFVTVKAVDAVGLAIEVKSNGVIVDTTRPVFTGEVEVRGVKDVINATSCVYVSSKITLQVTWIGFSDGHSSLDHYEWAVIPASRNVTARDFRRVSGSSLTTSASFSGLTMADGSTYRVVIRAYNRALLYKDALSVLVIPDSSPPQAGVVSDGPNAGSDYDYQASLAYVKASWTIFNEPHTGIRQYYYAVGSCVQGNYHVTGNRFIKASPATSTSFFLQNLNLVNGQRYCTKVKAQNMAGLYSKEVSSNGFMVDVTVPVTREARVIDGVTQTDIDYQNNVTEMSASWEGVSDPESGLKYYEYGISRNRAGAPNVTSISFTNNGLQTFARATGLALGEDVYYFIVCAVNNAGLKNCLSSDGVLIDTTPPSKGIVNDGVLEPDLKYQSSLTSMAANWEGIWDLESQIERFEWAIKDNSSGNVALPFTDVGLATHVKNDNPLSLTNGRTYQVHLKIYNHVGTVREITSDGVTVDNTAPLPSTIYPGSLENSDWTYNMNDKTFYTSKTSEIFVYWDAFAEPESEVWFYKWAIGTSKCGTQVQPPINIGQLTNVNTSTSDLNLRYGVKYYVTVTSRNKANLVSRSCSDARLMDNTPPNVGSVNVGCADEHQKYIGSEMVHIYWNDFTDHESGVEFCNVYVKNSSSTIFINKVLDMSTGMTSVSNTVFVPGQEYKALVKCFNKAQLFSSLLSNFFIIDVSAPVPQGSISAGYSRDNAMQYQALNNSITITWQPFKDLESPIKEYWVAVGDSPLGDNVVPLSSNGLSTESIRTDLTLVHGLMYYITVYGVNAAGLNTTLQALPLRIDVTPPVSSNANIKDGSSGEDWDFFNPKEPVSGHWEEVSDPESGIVKSEYCLGLKPLGCQIQKKMDIGNKISFTCSDCKVDPGERVYLAVQLTNGAGLSVTRASNGMLLDSTPPMTSKLIDGNDPSGYDVDTALFDWNITVTWQGIEDRESGVKQCMWSIVHSEEKELFSVKISGPFKLGQKQVLSAERAYSSLPFNASRLYYNMIICSNGARLNAVASSDGFRVVSEWPITALVRDGCTKGKDLDYVTSTKDVGANWDAFKADQRDPVIEYLWAIGTTPGSEDVMKYKSAGLSLHDKVTLAADEPDLDVLNTGQRYYITVKAVSASGMTSNRSSNGFNVDITPPVKSDVEVTFALSDQSVSKVDLRIDWSGVSDNESDIVDSEYCVGTTPGNCLTDRYSAGRGTIAVLASFKPISLANYYAIVIVRNRAGLASVLTSRKISIDTSPPSRGQVIDGTGRDVDFMNVTSTLSCQWAGFEDRDSNVKNCKWKLIQQSVSSDGSYFGNDSIEFEQVVSSRGNESRQGLSLSPGSRYLNQITCANRDGFTVTSVSNGVVIDVTTPTSGTVVDGDDFSNDIDFMSGLIEVKTIWRGFKDDESGIMGYRWALGTSPGKDDVLRFRNVGKQRQGFAANVSLSPIGAYYVTVEAKNQAGMTSQGWSDGFVVDATPPEISKLTRGSKAWIGPDDTISATWQSRDPESSVKNTEYCVGTSPNVCQIQQMKSIPGNSTQVTCTECKLSHSVKYYVTIRIWNQAGLYSIDTTEGVKADLTPPLQGQVIPRDDVISCVQNCTLSTTVSGFIDPESGLGICQFAIRTSSSQYIVPFTNFSQLTYVQASGLTLVPGQRYYTIVRCVNNVGLSTNATSDGVLVDATPPAKGVVIVSPDRTHDVYGIHSSCHLYNSTMRIHWSGFYDTESSITGFRVAVGRHPNATNIQSFVDVGITTSFSLNIGPSEGLLSGDIVYILLEARNAAGLTTRAVSSPTRLVAADNEQYSREGDFYCLDV